MQPEEFTPAINKALECWSLQIVCDTAILASFVIWALVAGALRSLRDRSSGGEALER